MKKSLLFLLTVLFCVGLANAKSYTITFKAETEANYNLTAEEIAALVTEGSSYINSFSFEGSICEGKNGIRISQNASLTLNLSAEGQVAATSVVVKARKRTSMMNSGDAQLTLNGSAPQTLNDANNDQVLTFDLTGSTLTDLVFAASGNGVYISSITVNYMPSYSITFKAENEANYGLTAEEIAALVASGSSYIESFSFEGTICEGKNGIRISQNASLTLNLSAEGQVAATSVVVKARKRTSMMNSGDAQLTLNGSAPETLNDANNDQVLTFDLDASTLSSLVFAATGNGVYISSITINYAPAYSIAFKAENEANYGLTTEEIAALVTEGSSYINSFSFEGTICEGKNGIRISQNASLTINLSAEGQVAATSVVVTARKRTSMMNSGDATLTLNGSAPQTINDANNDQTLTFDLDGSKLTDLVFAAAGNGVYIKTITVKEGGVLKKDVELSFDKESVMAVNGGEFTAPVLTCSVEGLEIEYTSSNTAVATVDNTGKVTMTGAGETTITARFAGNNEYRAAQASYTLTVASVINSWSEFTALNSVQPFKALTAKINFPCTVTYQTTVNSARHTYVVANGVAMLIYGDVPDYEAGDVIPAGWIATYKQPVSSKYYCAVVDEAPEASTEKATFTTTETTNVSTISTYYGIYIVNDVDFQYGPQANQYGNIIGKYIEVSGRQKIEKEITFRDYFGIPGSDVAGKYNVTFIAENNGAGGTILCPVKYELVESTGIDSILEEEIPAEYYNLDGIRVENPTNGLYIRRQGDKVTKVIIR